MHCTRSFQSFIDKMPVVHFWTVCCDDQPSSVQAKVLKTYLKKKPLSTIIVKPIAFISIIPLILTKYIDKPFLYSFHFMIVNLNILKSCKNVYFPNISIFIENKKKRINKAIKFSLTNQFTFKSSKLIKIYITYYLFVTR